MTRIAVTPSRKLGKKLGGEWDKPFYSPLIKTSEFAPTFYFVCQSLVTLFVTVKFYLFEWQILVLRAVLNKKGCEIYEGADAYRATLRGNYLPHCDV